MGDSSITVSLRFQARALAAQHADKISSKWLVGTNSLREENEISVLQYDPDQERLTAIKTYVHAPEIWDIAPSSQSQDLFLTVWSKGGDYGVTLWNVTADDKLEAAAELPGHQSTIRSALWHTQQHDLAVTIEEGGLRKWSISDQGVQAAGSASSGELQQLWSGALHPQNPDMALTAGGNNVQLWDFRSMTKTAEVVGAHRMPTRDVSFAAHDQNRIVSAGDDCKLRFWDLRYMGKSEALLELGGHSHWVWRAQYNPFHDSLVASSSSDSLVNLYHTPQLAASTSGESDLAVSSAAMMTARAGDLDGKAHTFDEHEDSVYGLAWSAIDPWLFASLSYDGRVVINKVPKNVKYKVII
eukprot:gene4935-34706_t